MMSLAVQKSHKAQRSALAVWEITFVVVNYGAFNCFNRWNYPLIAAKIIKSMKFHFLWISPKQCCHVEVWMRSRVLYVLPGIIQHCWAANWALSISKRRLRPNHNHARTETRASADWFLCCCVSDLHNLRCPSNAISSIFLFYHAAWAGAFFYSA